MKLQDQHFYTFNWNEFVHLEFLRALMRLVPNFDLSTFDDIQTVEKVSVTTDENNENPLEISYISKIGEEKTLHIAPEITKRVNELISERIKINNDIGEAQDWQTIRFDWNSENEGDQETVKPLEISFQNAGQDDVMKFAIPQIRIFKDGEDGTNIPKFIDFQKDAIYIYSTVDENKKGQTLEYDFTLYLTKEEAKQVYATIDALNEFKDEVSKTYSTTQSLTELQTALNDKIGENVKTLTDEQNAIKSNISAISTDVETLKTETTQLTTDTDTLKTDMTDVKDKLENGNNEVSIYTAQTFVSTMNVTGFYYDVTTQTAYNVNLNYTGNRSGLIVTMLTNTQVNSDGANYLTTIPESIVISDLSYTKGDIITDYLTPFDKNSSLYLNIKCYTPHVVEGETGALICNTASKFHDVLAENDTNTLRTTAYANTAESIKNDGILIAIHEDDLNESTDKLQIKIDSLVDSWNS